MAWLLGEKVGESVGYTVRGERVVGRHARVEVVTTGVLLQRLQRDQELAGVDTVILDECHERHLDADTVAAFLVDVREALRPELRLVAASATTDAQGWARLLGDAPVVEAEGVAYPVEVVWTPPVRPVRPPHGMRVDPALLTHVASTVRRALGERDGDVLCFLPGVGEIARVAGQLGDLGGTEVLQVHGRAPAAVQDAVLSPGTRRRVVLATAVAESSLTVPGVRVVVDSGLAREPRVDHARGLSALATVRASQAAGRQRAGRAGREAPGAVYRCWAEAEDSRLPRFPAPEIKVADLTAFALQVACWGILGRQGWRCSMRRRVERWPRRGVCWRRSGPSTRVGGLPLGVCSWLGWGCIPGWGAPCWTRVRPAPRSSRCSVRRLRGRTGMISPGRCGVLGVEGTPMPGGGVRKFGGCGPREGDFPPAQP